MIYVIAPTVREAEFWLREFGTPRREATIVPLPRRTRMRARLWDLHPNLMGRRWQDGDEFLLVGNPAQLEYTQVKAAVSYLRVPTDVVDAELGAVLNRA